MTIGHFCRLDPRHRGGCLCWCGLENCPGPVDHGRMTEEQRAIALLVRKLDGTVIEIPS